MTPLPSLGEDVLCRRTLDHLAAPVRIWTPSDGVVYVNRCWLDLTGTRLEENIGDRWLQCVHEDDREAIRTALDAAEQAVRSRAYRLHARDGETVAVTDQWSALTDGAEHIVGRVHTVTPQPGAAAEEDRTKVMSKWAHELRGPLNAILGWSDLLSAGENNADVVQRGLKAIANNARQQAAIIKRMTE